VILFSTLALLKLLSLSHVICFAQYVSEKIGGAKGTELDDEFTDMERVIIHLLHLLVTCLKIWFNVVTLKCFCTCMLIICLFCFVKCYLCF